MEIDCPFTPAALKKVVYAGTQSRSFAQARKDLEALAEVRVTAQRIQRWTKRVGEERLAEVRRSAEAYEQLPLPARQASPTEQVPQVACVMMDGGRIQIRDRHARAGVDSHWRETLVGCCLRMTSDEHAQDPCPVIPRTFVDPARMRDLSREIKGFSSAAEPADEPPLDAREERLGQPQVLVKSVVATRAGQPQFGRRLVAEAYRRGFHAAPRKAFVADGSASNWSVHQQHFAHYTPVLDFTHAICYVYAAALAGRSAAAGWDDYVCWAQWLWEGAVERVIAAVAARAEQLGPPAAGEETSPAALVARTLCYLQNQRPRMKYHEYRRRGLPITSSHIESTIKQINRRVKGTEKFWHEGAEPLLQLTADHLDETHDFRHFWRRRAAQLSTTRRYHSAA